jgi:PadR family transcriptional regulator, regulatory protein PadR
MAPRPLLRQLDLLVLLALMRLGDDAYGLPIAREIRTASGRDIPLASLYAALGRLEDTRLVRSELGSSTPERGGRAKRYFRITATGLREVRTARQTLTRLWQGLPQLQQSSQLSAFSFQLGRAELWADG